MKFNATVRNVLFGAAIAGTLFSGYLSGSKLFGAGCPFDSQCPYFLGLPACLYGFAMFFSLMIVTGITVFKKEPNSHKKWLNVIWIIALLGTIFGGYFSIKELFFSDCEGAFCDIHRLGIPSCVYGWLDFVLIFAVSSVVKFKKS